MPKACAKEANEGAQRKVYTHTHTHTVSRVVKCMIKYTSVRQVSRHKLNIPATAALIQVTFFHRLMFISYQTMGF